MRSGIASLPMPQMHYKIPSGYISINVQKSFDAIFTPLCELRAQRWAQDRRKRWRPTKQTEQEAKKCSKSEKIISTIVRCSYFLHTLPILCTHTHVSVATNDHCCRLETQEKNNCIAGCIDVVTSLTILNANFIKYLGEPRMGRRRNTISATDIFLSFRITW